MRRKKAIKLAVFNGLLCLVNVVLFSKAFFGLDLSGTSALGTAFGVMVIVMNLVLFGLVNYNILFPPQPPPPPPISELKLSKPDDCIQALESYILNNNGTFTNDLRSIIDQLRRMEKRKATIRGVLLERFAEGEMSYVKFQGAVDGVENFMLRNVRSLLKRVHAFDEDEYEDALQKGSGSSRLRETRQAILREYTAYVARSVEDNEEILLRLDKLILEISKLDDFHTGDVEDLPAMREIDSLIEDTKWYK